MASGTTSVAPACAQPLHLGVVDGAHDHRHLGRVRLHEAQDLQRRGGVLVAHHHRAGARQAGGHQALQPRGVAEHHALAGRGGLAHAVGVEVQRHVGDALAFEDARQVLAAAAVAGDDHVRLGVDRALGDRRHRHRLHQPVGRRQLHHDAVAVHHEQRRGQHRQHHAGQHRAQPLRVDQLVGRRPASAARSRTRRPAPGTGRCAAPRRARRRTGAPARRRARTWPAPGRSSAAAPAPTGRAPAASRASCRW